MKPAAVEEEYQKNVDLNREELKKLIEWHAQQPHLPKITELEAILFFHSCNYRMELAKQTLDIYFTLRTHLPEFFSNLNIDHDDVQHAMHTVDIFPIEKRTPEGYKVYVSRLSNFDASKFNFAMAIKLFFMIFDLVHREEGSSPGHIIVMDQTGVAMGHLARLGPLTMKKFLCFLQDATPIRIVGFHFINIVPFSDKIIALMRPFMKRELSEVLFCHNNVESLQKYIPLEILPRECGGSAGSIAELRKNVYEHVKDNQEFFTELESRKVNENLRPGKPKDASDLFGAAGNFKKLNID